MLPQGGGVIINVASSVAGAVAFLGGPATAPPRWDHQPNQVGSRRLRRARHTGERHLAQSVGSPEIGKILAGDPDPAAPRTQMEEW
jgi:hypothetical protein